MSEPKRKLSISTIGVKLPPDMEKAWQEAVDHKLKQDKGSQADPR